MDITEIKEKAKTEGVDFKTALMLTLDELASNEDAIVKPGKCPNCGFQTVNVAVLFDTTQDSNVKHPVIDTRYEMQCVRSSCNYVGGKADSMTMAIFYYEDDTAWDAALQLQIGRMKG